jgi:hypothetical protein
MPPIIKSFAADVKKMTVRMHVNARLPKTTRDIKRTLTRGLHCRGEKAGSAEQNVPKLLSKSFQCLTQQRMAHGLRGAQRHFEVGLLPNCTGNEPRNQLKATRQC